ncbi:MAG: DUF996 domain-containing protein [Desulfurococcus sp.]|nr:DUF996 domain-containing protein [Desulfurococcus sp.]
MGFAFSTAIARRITYSTYSQLSPAELYSILTESIGVLILAWIMITLFAISGAIFYRTAFKLLAEKSGEKLFDTAGLLMLIGAVLTIIVIGGILTLIACILAAVAFFSIKPPSAAAPQPPPPSPQ